MAFMRHNNNGRRHNNNFHRNRNSSGGGNNQQQGQSAQRRQNRANHVFESNGPDGRVRGTAQQIVEKYATMARDAAVSGDKVLSLNYLQHAEHYQRLWNEIAEETAVFEREREQQRQQQQAQQPEATQTGAFVPQAETQNQPQGQVQNADQDDNALPNFLQVPITSGQSESSAEGRGNNRPHRPRRPNTAGSPVPTKNPEEN